MSCSSVTWPIFQSLHAMESLPSKLDQMLGTIYLWPYLMQHSRVWSENVDAFIVVKAVKFNFRFVLTLSINNILWKHLVLSDKQPKNVAASEKAIQCRVVQSLITMSFAYKFYETPTSKSTFPLNFSARLVYVNVTFLHISTFRESCFQLKQHNDI